MTYKTYPQTFKREKLPETPMSVKLRPSIHNQIQLLCFRHNVSMNSLINDLLSNALNMLQKDYESNTDKPKIILLSND